MCFKVPAWVYLPLNVVVSSLLSGAIDAGLTAAMYSGDTYKEVKVFEWPNTLAGNIILTALIQTTITWFLCMSLIRNGMRAKVLGIGKFPRPECCDFVIMRIFFYAEDLLRCPPEGGCSWRSVGKLFLSILKQLSRGLLFGFTMVWLIGWPVTLIMYGIEERHIDEYEYWWLIVFMGVYGFCLGVVIGIPINIIALMSPVEEEYEEEVDEVGEEGGGEKIPDSETSSEEEV